MKMNKRALIALGAFAALAPLTATSFAATTTNTQNVADRGVSTRMDSVIDQYVDRELAAGRVTAVDAKILREQLQIQFSALSSATQNKILAMQNTSTVEGLLGAVAALKDAMANAARENRAAMIAAEQSAALANGAQPKLGADGDLVFVATVGPCRVADTRYGGQLPAATGGQIYAYSVIGGYDWANQGGTGLAGSGNCAGTVYLGTAPVDAVATITVVNTASVGSLQVWNGGTTLTVGAALAWNPGDRLSNTTVIPLNRSITPYPGSGAKRDFGVFNNSSTPVDIIVDVVGYFIRNQATPLDCTRVVGTSASVGAFNSDFIFAPSCPSGYTAMGSLPDTAGQYGMAVGTIYTSGCRINNLTGAAKSAQCDAFCCRVPGR